MFLNRGKEGFEEAVNSKIYVDKTDMITIFNEKINTEQKCISVSRPRRFGKSMTVNMMNAYYQKGCDSRSLFENRKLGRSEGWDKHLNQYDVIRIDLAGVRSEIGDGEKTLDFIEDTIIKELYEEYPEAEKTEHGKTASALYNVNKKYGNKFVIIIDEWDCLFRDDKSNFKVQERYINLLRSLFKGDRAKNFLALGYITGILPIKKYNSESALNNFYEYTMITPYEFAKYIGFTEDEVKSLCEKYDMDYDKTMEWYDGYSFYDTQHICGPNSVVRAMLHKRVNNYWSQTVVYNSLESYITMNMEGLKEDIKTMIGGQKITVDTFEYENDMVNFKSKDDVLTLLIHLGYLAYDAETEKAWIPNKEVRQIFEKSIKTAKWNELLRLMSDSEELLESTLAGDEDTVAECIERSHEENTSILNYNNENALAACITLSYYSAKNDYILKRELAGGKGYADMVFVPKKDTLTPPIIVELKWNKSTKSAIAQMKEKKYARALGDYKGEVVLVGISYDKEKKKHTCRIEKATV